jgi:hypothetical protein
MLLNLEGIWSDWMAAAALGMILFSGALLALCSLCGLCAGCEQAARRNAASARRMETQQSAASGLRRAA